MYSLHRPLLVAVLLVGTVALAAGQDAPAAPPAATSQPSPESVTGAAAWERLKGNTITGKIGGQQIGTLLTDLPYHLIRRSAVRR